MCRALDIVRTGACGFLAVVSVACTDETVAAVDEASMAMGGSAGARSAADAWVIFHDPDSTFASGSVYDADREVVRFEAESNAMLWPGDVRLAGWRAQGNQLAWDQSSVAFQVRFGSEGGQRRAYFTEAAAGTICDLDLTDTHQLRIYATSEFPPRP